MLDRFDISARGPGAVARRSATVVGSLLCVLLFAGGAARGGEGGDTEQRHASAESVQGTASGAAESEEAEEPLPLDQVFPWTGEQFYYSLRVNGSEAMRASVKVGEFRRNGERPYVPIGLSVHSFGFFDNVYPVDDRADTYLDPLTTRPYRTEKYFREAGRIRTYIVDYLHDRFKARVHKSKPGKSRNFDNAIPSTTHDMLTWMYDLRRREFAAGETHRFFIYDGWKMSHVHVTVEQKEDLYTPAGWFKAWKLRFVRKIVASKGNKQGGERTAPVLRVEDPSEATGHFWVSRDENHLPLRITIPTKFGAGEAVLIEYERPERR